MLRDLIQRFTSTLRDEGIDRAILLAIRYLSWRIRYHKLIASLPVFINNFIFTINSAIYGCMLSTLHRIYPRKYTDANIYKLLLVDPCEISSEIDPSNRRRGWVETGSWDTNTTNFMDREIPTAIIQHYDKEIPWDCTSLVNYHEGDKKEAIKHGRRIENLKNLLCEQGYMSQRDISSKNPRAAWDNLNDAMHPIVNEIAVDIGRDGELIWNMAGQHRLALAKVLELDHIYVQVYRRHSKWQSYRADAVNNKPVPEHLTTHPDLQDLLTQT